MALRRVLIAPANRQSLNSQKHREPKVSHFENPFGNADLISLSLRKLTTCICVGGWESAAHTISGVGVTVPNRNFELGMDEGTFNLSMHARFSFSLKLFAVLSSEAVKLTNYVMLDQMSR